MTTYSFYVHSSLVDIAFPYKPSHSGFELQITDGDTTIAKRIDLSQKVIILSSYLLLLYF